MGIEQLAGHFGRLRPNFIAVCLDEAEDRAQQPRILHSLLIFLLTHALCILYTSQPFSRIDRVLDERFLALPQMSFFNLFTYRSYSPKVLEKPLRYLS